MVEVAPKNETHDRSVESRDQGGIASILQSNQGDEKYSLW